MRTLSGYDLKTKFSRKRLFDKLVENRKQHSELFQEAKEGYLRAAQEKLLAKIEELRNGTLSGLNFNLSPPEDKTDVYDTAIQMLEWSQEDYIELTATEFRNLVMDEWDWKDHWLHMNRIYGESIQTQATMKGL